jgi:hypothetical protein
LISDREFKDTLENFVLLNGAINKRSESDLLRATLAELP